MSDLSFVKRFIAPTVCTVCSWINYKIVPVNNLNKYLHYGTMGLTNTGLFKMTVGVLTTCHTQFTSDSSICIFLFNRTTLPVFVTHLTGALYLHRL